MTMTTATEDAGSGAIFAVCRRSGAMVHAGVHIVLKNLTI
jgi:hypothetical protein